MDENYLRTCFASVGEVFVIIFFLLVWTFLFSFFLSFNTVCGLLFPMLKIYVICENIKVDRLIGWIVILEWGLLNNWVRGFEGVKLKMQFRLFNFCALI